MVRKINNLSIVLAIFVIKFCYAGDADNLYDVCPASDGSNQRIFINGLPCKDPLNITASDFKSSILTQGGDTDNFYRSAIVTATAAEFPGLNTLGLSAARTDIEVDGIVTPHAHPRASEIAFVRRGVVVAGFVDSNNLVFQKRLEAGDVFIFPKGLLHFFFNGGFEDATVLSVLNSQNPGFAGISGAMFMGNSGDSSKRVMEWLKSRSSEGDLDGIQCQGWFTER